MRRTLYAMASTMAEDPNAFSGRLVWRAAQQCNNVAEVRRETASALTLAKMAVVHSPFVLAHFRGR